jgi:beta-galactosidase
MIPGFLIHSLSTFKKSAAFAAALALFSLAAPATAAEALPKPGETKNFTIGKDDFLLDGKRIQIRCGEIHAARVPREYWQHRLRMCKAMGLNTVCAYLFWNMHEPEEGKFNWSDRADVAEFCRLAAAEGLWVILRPGPYACAEWEMGGTPWWLLQKAPIELRSRDPKFMEPAKRYLREVGRVLGPLQVTRGGPILMVQVENEYGFYGEDADYVRDVRQALLDAGFDVPLFDCNPTYRLGIGSPPDLFHVVNFGSNPNEGFDKLRQLQPQGPLMCGEFYPGWFDTWGNPHNRGNAQNYLRDLETMLKRNGSFSIYMAHGGTTFGLWAGCDRPFKPDTSSYDYDAPISEAGWATEKFHLTRELFAKHLLPGETLPEIPAPLPVISFPAVRPLDAAPVFANLPAAIRDEVPRNIEAYGLGYGCMLYRTKVPAGDAAPLEAAHVADFGHVFLDGKAVGILDRRRPSQRFILPARTKEASLDILVQPMGRVNFGKEMNDPKGLRAPVKLAGTELKNWEIFPMPLGDPGPTSLKFDRKKPSGPAFWRMTFDLTKTGDTFLDLRGWGKGIVWLNGRCLGRFWNIGPTQTAYAPGCWMKKGSNEIIILDFTGPTDPTVAGLEKPILDQLRPELDFGARRSKVTLNLPAALHTGEFPAGTGVQEVKFPQPASGRYFCLESIDAHDGGAHAAVAELDLLGTDGQPVSRSAWSIAHVSSEERTAEDGSAENAIDGQTANFWHSEWKNQSPAHPHRLVLDLGKTTGLGGFRYTPRQSDGAGRIRHYKVYCGDGLVRPVDP